MKNLSNKFTLWSKTHSRIPYEACAYGTQSEAASAILSPMFHPSTRSDLKVISMVGVQIRIVIHEFYVHTKIRFYNANTLTYIEYGLFGADVPKRVFECETQDDLRNFVNQYEPSEVHKNEPYLPEFFALASLVVLLPIGAPVRDFEIESARYVDAKKGGRDVTGAFRDPNFKERIFKNLLQQIHDKNVPKLIKVLNALDVVGA